MFTLGILYQAVEVIPWRRRLERLTYRHPARLRAVALMVPDVAFYPALGGVRARDFLLHLRHLKRAIARPTAPVTIPCMQRSLFTLSTAFCVSVTLGCSDDSPSPDDAADHVVDAQVSSDVHDASATDVTSDQPVTSGDLTEDSSSDLDAAIDVWRDAPKAPLEPLDSSVPEDAARAPVDAQTGTSDFDASSDLADASTCAWTVDELLARAGLSGTYAFDCGESAYGEAITAGVECVLGTQNEALPVSDGGVDAALADASPTVDGGTVFSDAALLGDSGDGASPVDSGAQNRAGARFVKSYSPDCLVEGIYLRLSSGALVLVERGKALSMPERWVTVRSCTTFDLAGACQQSAVLYECNDRAGVEADCSRRFD